MKQTEVNYFFFLDFPTLDKAIATDWACDFPAFISLRMLALTTLFDEPFFNGIKPPRLDSKPANG